MEVNNLHERTSKELLVSVDVAKVINFGSLYSSKRKIDFEAKPNLTLANNKRIQSLLKEALYGSK